MRAYGKQQLVCYKHRSNWGAASMRYGNCENCKEPVSTPGGALPKLCNECSSTLNECAYCRVKLE